MVFPGLKILLDYFIKAIHFVTLNRIIRLIFNKYNYFISINVTE